MLTRDIEGRAVTAPTDPKALYANSITLVAVPTAVSCARVFTRALLDHWNLKDHSDVAELVMSELVSNAVKAVGFVDQTPKSWEITARHVLGVQLRIIDTTLYVEVWDSSTSTPERQTVSLDAEGGRGLLLVESLCQKWGVYRPDVGGKIVWSQLSLVKEAQPSAGAVELPHRVPGATNPPNEAVKELATTALMQRVLEGLRSSL